MAGENRIYVGGGSGPPASEVVGPERPPTDMSVPLFPEAGDDYVAVSGGDGVGLVEVGPGREPPGEHPPEGYLLVDVNSFLVRDASGFLFTT